MKEHAVEAAIAAFANKATPVAAGVAVLGSWNANDVAAIGGFFMAVVGVCVQIYYKRKADKRDAAQDARDAAQALRDAAEHLRRMSRLRDE